MAEIVLGPDDSVATVAKALLKLAGDSPDRVMWSPRPDVTQGGVYVVDDEIASRYSGGARRGRKAAGGTEDTTTTGAPATETTTTTGAPAAEGNGSTE